ncbi:hypothetical protein MJO28_014767 [Puccinia striiformis f. sp. tritici]|uniref:Uncharacterized protein n=1 Tax=Puccinia striiformis f. sp. tritici TaxID=168172 RepID=A0ACC0DWA7_9BASI|nr:hypothetical protein MJO28_014767 [Puccinia striiformis f. sp. tritici]
MGSGTDIEVSVIDFSFPITYWMVSATFLKPGLFLSLSAWSTEKSYRWRSMSDGGLKYDWRNIPNISSNVDQFDYQGDLLTLVRVRAARLEEFIDSAGFVQLFDQSRQVVDNGVTEKPTDRGFSIICNMVEICLNIEPGVIEAEGMAKGSVDGLLPSGKIFAEEREDGMVLIVLLVSFHRGSQEGK